MMTNNQSNTSNNVIIKKFISGIIGGIANVVLFNPFDRALYLSTGKSSHPFKKQYFQNPFQGVSNAMFQRIISYGFYEPINDILYQHISNNKISDKYSGILSSVATCCFTGVITSPVSSIKMTNWNTDHDKKLIKLAKIMYKDGGFRSFFRGTAITMQREMIFGAILGYLTVNYNNQKNFYLDLMSFSIATIIASPVNYIRIIIYRSPIDSTPSIKHIIDQLSNDIKIVYNKTTLFKTMKYVIINKFNVGWGTIRVALGMSISRHIYLLLNSFDK